MKTNKKRKDKMDSAVVVLDRVLEEEEAAILEEEEDTEEIMVEDFGLSPNEFAEETQRREPPPREKDVAVQSKFLPELQAKRKADEKKAADKLTEKEDNDAEEKPNEED